MNLNIWSISCGGGILLFIVIAIIRLIIGRRFPKFCPDCGRELVPHTEVTKYDKNTGLPIRWYHQVACPKVRWKLKYVKVYLLSGCTENEYEQNAHYAQTWYDNKDHIKGYEDVK